MTTECPGCSRSKSVQAVFCPRCEERLPWDLPGVRDWRRSLAWAQQTKNVYRAQALISHASAYLSVA